MTLQSDLCATLVDEWCRAGLTEAVVAPGSRSSLLTLALLADERVRVHVRLDERSAAYFALGIALCGRAPVALVTTSGTAAVEVHAAVVEADLSRVPLLVCTADRPVELHGVGAPQTIEQSGALAGIVRSELDLGVAEEATRPYWRSLASRLVAEALGSVSGPGPVHLNLALREPFEVVAGTPPPGRVSGGAWHEVVRAREPSDEVLAAFLAALGRSRRGLFVAGGSLEDDSGTEALELAAALGWPVLAEPRAMSRRDDALVIAHADAILRSPVAAASLSPDCVVQLGVPHASKVLTRWLEALGSRGTERVLIDPFGAFADPERQAGLVLGTSAPALCAAAVRALLAGGHSRADATWSGRWRRADDAAAGAIAAYCSARDELDEPFIARELYRVLPAGSVLFSSSSMPVRDLEWFAAARADGPRVLSNRGASGIDGITSTALGIATALGAGERAAALIGDLAFFHDLSGLVFGTNEVAPDATLVVVDNAGGGIFSFLDYAPTLAPSMFERGFGTPQDPDCALVAGALGAHVTEVRERADLVPAIERALAHRGVDVVVARTSRSGNLAVHAEIAGAVAAAVGRALE